MALALGGMTVEELKSRMTLDELNGWGEYIRINGPLNPILRNDAAIARLGVSMAGRGAKMENFMPWPIKEPEPLDPEKVMAKLQAAFRQNKVSK